MGDGFDYPVVALSVVKKESQNKIRVQLVDRNQRVMPEENKLGRKAVLNVGDLPKGNYFLRVWFNDKAMKPKHLVVGK